jgi:hypothetical protein
MVSFVYLSFGCFELLDGSFLDCGEFPKGFQYDDRYAEIQIAWPTSVNTKCLGMTYTKNFCITCTQDEVMQASGDGCGGGYHCRDQS